VCAALVALGVQTAANLKRRGIASGFGYLHRAAGFELPAGPVPFSSHHSYARALELGLANTLRVTLLGIALAAGLGVLIGIARLSTVRLVAALARGYVELVRGVPVLLHLVFWYAVTQTLPAPRDALQPLPGVYLCVRGLFLPGLAWHGPDLGSGAALLGAGLLLGIGLALAARWKRGPAGRASWVAAIAGGLLFAAVAALVMGVSLGRPVLDRFDFQGGFSISPEFFALLTGLTSYTAAFIAEIVRGGLLAVSRGQSEAAAALGLSRGMALRLVVLPQALRMIVPPATSQFLNLAKNTSLAVAIGYGDLMSITDATLNQTGQAVEAMAVAICLYLLMNLAISSAMNYCNRRVAFGGTGATHP
jgi:general L-amino acid transport system permease protein